jgi:hypothetical protein
MVLHLPRASCPHHHGQPPDRPQFWRQSQHWVKEITNEHTILNFGARGLYRGKSSSWLLSRVLCPNCINWSCIPVPHCTENHIYVFQEMKLCGLVPNSYIHVSVSDLYIPRICLPFWLQRNRQTDPGNIQIAHRYMNTEIGRQNIIILFGK